jgi:hypothetical protein
MSSYDHFLEKMQFSDQATFHKSGAVDRRSVRIWRSENTAYVKHQRDSPKVNVFCAISSQKVYSPFFFAEETVSDDISGHVAAVANATVAKHTDIHIPARWKSHPLPL